MNNSFMNTGFNGVPTRQDELNMVNNQIARLEQMRNQLSQPIQQPPAINQTFQLAPTPQSTLRFANTIDDVMKENVFGDTPYFSKDMSIMWIKNNKNEIKTYELSEIIPKDEKDILIDSLQSQINEMSKQIKEMNENAKSNSTNVDESIKDEESTSVPICRTSTKKSK